MVEQKYVIIHAFLLPIKFDENDTCVLSQRILFKLWLGSIAFIVKWEGLFRFESVSLQRK
jgi:hypothetical protein